MKLESLRTSDPVEVVSKKRFRISLRSTTGDLYKQKKNLCS